jgi:hypothetical protein
MDFNFDNLILVYTPDSVSQIRFARAQAIGSSYEALEPLSHCSMSGASRNCSRWYFGRNDMPCNCLRRPVLVELPVLGELFTHVFLTSHLEVKSVQLAWRK